MMTDQPPSREAVIKCIRQGVQVRRGPGNVKEYIGVDEAADAILAILPQPQVQAGEVKRAEVGDIIVIRTVVAKADETSVLPSTGWHSRTLILANEGPNGQSRTSTEARADTPTTPPEAAPVAWRVTTPDGEHRLTQHLTERMAKGFNNDGWTAEPLFTAAPSPSPPSEQAKCFECGGFNFADRVCLTCNVIDDRLPSDQEVEAVARIVEVWFSHNQRSAGWVEYKNLSRSILSRPSPSSSGNGGSE